MQPVLTVAEMQAVDAAAAATAPLDVLVERAGTAVARSALDLLGGAYGRRVVLVCGTGNNGADGRVAARLLAGRGARVRSSPPASPRSIGDTGPGVDLVVDAAFGTGFRGAYDAPTVDPGIPVLAVDIPSGVAGDTGGASGRVLAAVRTVTFVAPKPGLLQGDGARLAGAVEVVDIGLPVGDHRIDLVEDADVAGLLPGRDPEGNKWSAAVAVVAGSPGMTGAAALCARAAYRAGAGMVRLGVPGGDPAHLPATEAVGVELPGDRLGRRPRWRPPTAAGRWWWARGSGGPTAPGNRCVGWSPGRPSRWWSTPTGCTRSAGSTAARWMPPPPWC